MHSYNEKQQLAAPLTAYDAESGIKSQQNAASHSANQKSGVRLVLGPLVYDFGSYCQSSNLILFNVLTFF
jgi:hypothetical protein